MKRILWLIAVSLLLFNSSNLKSDSLDSANVYKAILKIDHFNDDSVKDTIVGYSDNNKGFLPKKIIWGHDTTNNHIPDSLKVAQSVILYPNWENLTGSISFERVNSDTLIDLILMIWGRLKLDSTTYKDTATAIVIFGRRGLDTLSEFNLSNIDTFQIFPFIELKLRNGHEITDGSYRDYSKQPSFYLHKINISDTTSSPPKINTGIKDNIRSEVNVYPNPAIYFTNLELKRIPTGKYNIRLFNLDGNIVQEINIEINYFGDITKIINLEKIASGCYFLRISSDHSINGSYQIIITH